MQLIVIYIDCGQNTDIVKSMINLSSINPFLFVQVAGASLWPH